MKAQGNDNKQSEIIIRESNIETKDCELISFPLEVAPVSLTEKQMKAINEVLKVKKRSIKFKQKTEEYVDNDINGKYFLNNSDDIKELKNIIKTAHEFGVKVTLDYENILNSLKSKCNAKRIELRNKLSEITDNETLKLINKEIEECNAKRIELRNKLSKNTDNETLKLINNEITELERSNTTNLNNLYFLKNLCNGKDQDWFTSCFNSCMSCCDNNCSEHFIENDNSEFIIVQN